MNKAVMISIRPEWCEKILNGEKTIEVRKTKPKLEPPFKCYIYCTGGNALYRPLHEDKCNLAPRWEMAGLRIWYWVLNFRIIGEFTCNRILPIEVQDNGSIRNWNQFHIESSCVAYEDVAKYIGNGKTGCGWCISDLKIYDRPKVLTEIGITRPPQSWCYVEEK